MKMLVIFFLQRKIMSYTQNFNFVHLYPRLWGRGEDNQKVSSSNFWVKNWKNDNRSIRAIHNPRPRRVGAPILCLFKRGEVLGLV